MKRSPLKRTPFSCVGILSLSSFQRKAPSARPKQFKSQQRAASAADRIYWDRLAGQIGCIACRSEGNENPFVSIHHIQGRTKPGCHSLVLPLCAGHHQDGTGNDKSMIAVHPYKARFEARYGSQLELLAHANQLLGIA